MTDSQMDTKTDKQKIDRQKTYIFNDIRQTNDIQTNKSPKDLTHKYYDKHTYRETERDIEILTDYPTCKHTN
jgi:hypothetical protein